MRPILSPPGPTAVRPVSWSGANVVMAILRGFLVGRPPPDELVRILFGPPPAELPGAPHRLTERAGFGRRRRPLVPTPGAEGRDLGGVAALGHPAPAAVPSPGRVDVHAGAALIDATA